MVACTYGGSYTTYETLGLFRSADAIILVGSEFYRSNVAYVENFLPIFHVVAGTVSTPDRLIADQVKAATR